MQLASMGWSSILVRVGTGGEGDTTRVVAQRLTSKWITSMMVALPSRSMMHCCSPTPSGVPGTLKPRAVVEESKGAFGRVDERLHRSGRMAQPGCLLEPDRVPLSWEPGPGSSPVRLQPAPPPLLESSHAYLIGRPDSAH